MYQKHDCRHIIGGIRVKIVSKRVLTYMSGMINDVNGCQVGTGGVADKDKSSTFGEREGTGRITCTSLVRFADLSIGPDIKQRHRGILTGSGKRVSIWEILLKYTSI